MLHLLEISLSFLEGLALIASPCILPVLPLILSTSVEGGRKRPFGIILGFVIAFTAFALLSRQLVVWLGINLDIIKYGSLILLALFGFVLLSDRLSAKFGTLTQSFANIGSNLSARPKDGFFSGILIGIPIGLVWTPCAGPILAAALVEIIREKSNLNAFFLILAFAIGAGVPMLIISLIGRKIMAKLRFFTTHAEAVRKVFGVIILMGVAFIASGLDIQTLFAKKESPVASIATPTTTLTGLQDALPDPYPAPAFVGISTWLNSPPLTMASLKGKVVLVDFWTYSCINCLRTLPHLTHWYDEYHDKGLVIIGVHSPEFEFEKSAANVAAAIKAHGIHYPVALDNSLDTWTNFNNHYWPAEYLINQAGQVVYTHFGEGHYDITQNNIRYLLGLNTKATEKPESSAVSFYQTPETYLGYERSEHFASPEKYLPNAVQIYSLPKFLPANHWALQGPWKIENQRIVSQAPNATLQLNFIAKKVFLVLGTPDGKPIQAIVTLNGAAPGPAAGKDVTADGLLTVQQDKLYELINQSSLTNGLLEIKTDAPGLAAYAFTFGN